MFQEMTSQTVENQPPKPRSENLEVQRSQTVRFVASQTTYRGLAILQSNGKIVLVLPTVTDSIATYTV